MPKSKNTSLPRLRFLTCGSVDDGKSTLIGRLLYESNSVFDDQMDAVASESSKFGTQGDSVDLALLLDGLQAEREQGITIDVAYRYFSTTTRSFIAADAPGHEQYTRNMATAASNSDLAILLVNAKTGFLPQTRRHARIVSLLGIRHCILAVNKMDLVDHAEETFSQIAAEFQTFAKELEFRSVSCVPVSALNGDNVFTSSSVMSWYKGSSLIELLETAEIETGQAEAPFRMPVQYVNRPNSEFRGFCGNIASGSIKAGEKIVVLPSGKTTSVKEVIGPSSILETAGVDQAVTLLLADEVDVSRGDIIASADAPAEVADQIAAHVVWMDETSMLPERPYTIRFHSASCTAQVTDLVHRIDTNTGKKIASKKLELNEIGYCKLSLDREVAFDAYEDNRQTGSFVLIDRYTNATVGAGVIDFALRRASNIHWQETRIGKDQRAQMNGQKPCILWFTGLSGSGKSTIADRLEQRLQSLGRRTYLLDGDNVRHGLNHDLGFTDQDRVENVRRVGEVAKLMIDAGLIVLVSFISPFKAEREMARGLVEADEFHEIFVDTPLEVCEARDVKGLYKKARAGELKNFTGIDSDYEIPENPEILLKSAEDEVEALVDQILAKLGIN